MQLFGKITFLSVVLCSDMYSAMFSVGDKDVHNPQNRSRCIWPLATLPILINAPQ